MDSAFDPWDTAPNLQMLGPYRLQARIGVGGVGDVYRAEHTHDHRSVAIKVLKASLSSDEVLRCRFLTEPQTQARLQHPHVLRIFEWGDSSPQPWFAMELAHGSLEQFREPVAPDRSLRWIFDALLALCAAHRLGIVHRDVKPHNLLFGEDGEIRLADFGSARGPHAGATIPGEWLGTLGYMSPEQRQDARWVGPASDVYGMGATLFRVVTGRTPPGLFEGGFDSTRLPAEVVAVITNATRYRADERTPGARRMALEVTEAWAQLTGNSSQEWRDRLLHWAPPAEATAPRAPERAKTQPAPSWWRRIQTWFTPSSHLGEGSWVGTREGGALILEIGETRGWVTWESPIGTQVIPLEAEGPAQWRESKEHGGRYQLEARPGALVATYIHPRSGTRQEFILVKQESAAAPKRSR